MKATIEGKELVVRIDLEDLPYRASGSGRNLVVATTHGNQLSNLTIQGREVTISLIAYIPTI